MSLSIILHIMLKDVKLKGRKSDIAAEAAPAVH